jgi:MoxR-like ATPase
MKKYLFKKQFRAGSFVGDNINARAALLSGDPGIGKTTSVRLIAKKLGYEIIE